MLDIEGHSFSKMLTNTACICMITFEVVLGIISNQTSWKDTILYPNILILYLWFLIAPITSSLSIAFAFYFKHKELRKTIWRELKDRMNLN